MMNKFGIRFISLSGASVALAVVVAASGFAKPAMAGGKMERPVSVYVEGHLATDARLFTTLHIALDKGWKTYWREPGPFGIPPQLVLEGSENLEGFTLHLPEPKLISDLSGEYVGYDESPRFVLELEPHDAAQPVLAQFTLTFAVCREICIPESEVISLSLYPDARKAEEPVSAAKAHLPKRTSFIESLSREGNRVLAETEEAAYGLLLESADGTATFSMPEKLSDNRYAFQLVSGAIEEGSELRFTLLDGEGGQEQVIALPQP